MRSILQGVGEIDVVIRVALQVRAYVVASAHCYHASQAVWMTKVGVGRKCSAEACARCDWSRRKVAHIVANQRQNFICDVPIIARQKLSLPLRRRLLV